LRHAGHDARETSGSCSIRNRVEEETQQEKHAGYDRQQARFFSSVDGEPLRGAIIHLGRHGDSLSIKTRDRPKPAAASFRSGRWCCLDDQHPVDQIAATKEQAAHRSTRQQPEWRAWLASFVVPVPVKRFDARPVPRLPRNNGLIALLEFRQTASICQRCCARLFFASDLSSDVPTKELKSAIAGGTAASVSAF